jgi:Tfp pilus assembly PilM family ATPase
LLGQSPAAAGSPDKLMQVKNAILPLLENMVQDIERAAKYFFLQVLRLPAGHFDKLILSGGASSMNSLAAFLNSRLGIETQVNDAFSKFVVTDHSYRDNPDQLGSAGVSLNAALGLALRGL